MLSHKAKLTVATVNVAQRSMLFETGGSITQPVFGTSEFEAAKYFGLEVVDIIREAERDQIVVLDLSDLPPSINQEFVVYAILGGVMLARKERRGALVAVRWLLESTDEFALRERVLRYCWLLTCARERLMVPIPIVTEYISVLGELPGGPVDPRITALVENRLLTYHVLSVGPRASGNSPKSLGRLLRRYARHGLVVDRGYATRDELHELGLADRVHERARPKIWESVLAALSGREPAPVRTAGELA